MSLPGPLSATTARRRFGGRFIAAVGLGAAAAVAASCLGAFACGGDETCNLEPGGICQASGFCSYPDGECPSGQRYHRDASATYAGRCVEDDAATDTDTDTGPASVCATPWEHRYTGGSPTGVVFTADGGVLTIGAFNKIQLRELSPAGEPRWEQTFYKADMSTGAIRGRLVAGPDSLLAAGGTALSICGDPPTECSAAPILGTVSPATMEVLADDAHLKKYAWLGDAALAPNGELLVVGRVSDSAWMGRYAPAEWVELGERTRPDDSHARGVAIDVNGLAAVVGTIGSPSASASWIERVRVADGWPDACECALPGVSLHAVALAGEQVIVGGWRPTASNTSELWLAALPAACPLTCTPTWEASDAGSVEDALPSSAVASDTLLALTATSDGDVIAGGVLDDRPWLARYAADGALRWRRDASDEYLGAEGEVTALALHPDGTCLALAGVVDGGWWARLMSP